MGCATLADLQQQRQQQIQYQQQLPQNYQQITQQNLKEKQGLCTLNAAFEELLHMQKLQFEEYQKLWEQQNKNFLEMQKLNDQNLQCLKESLQKPNGEHSLQDMPQTGCPVGPHSPEDNTKEHPNAILFGSLQRHQHATTHEGFQQTDPIISDNLLEDEQIHSCTHLYQPERQTETCSEVPDCEKIAGGIKPLIAHHGVQSPTHSKSITYKEDGPGVTLSTTSQTNEIMLLQCKDEDNNSLQRKRKIDTQFRFDDHIYVLLFYTRRHI